MPELPELETIVRGLRALVGAELIGYEALDPKIARGLEGLTLPNGILGVRRRGKYIILQLCGQLLIVHLRLTGRLILSDRPLDGARLHLFSSKGVLSLEDRRGFATVEIADRFRKELGPEPFGDLSWLRGALRGSRRPIKLWLLDQRNIAGIGNIYASEILFRAGIDPRRAAGSLGPEEVERLAEAIPALLSEAIAAGGTTFSDYRDSQGRPGSFQASLKVYRRAGKPCPNCGAPIQRISLGGRSTFLCPRCQR